MCNLPAWLRAACLTTIALLAACNSDEVTFEPSMTLSGRVVADQPMTKSDVVGTWTAFNHNSHTDMGVSFSANGGLNYRLTQIDDKGVPVPAGVANWRVIDNILILKWPKQNSQDECVSSGADASFILHCTTIGGAEDGKTTDYGMSPINLASELPGTIWNSGNVTVQFTSSSRYNGYIEDEVWTGSWSTQGLRLTLKNYAICDFSGGSVDAHFLYFVCRLNGETDEVLIWWGRV